MQTNMARCQRMHYEPIFATLPSFVFQSVLHFLLLVCRILYCMRSEYTACVGWYGRVTAPLHAEPLRSRPWELRHLCQESNVPYCKILQHPSG
ncbi:hypothetical protein FKM82_026983 [Ascaphus truei]